jgi:hypothetical protein
MSLRIDVRTPPQLIERAREQQQQQRLAMVERQRQVRVRKEAERQVVRERLLTGRNERGERVTDGIELSGKRPWYGAQAVRKQYQVGMIEYSQNYDRTVVRTKNGSIILEVSLPAQEYFIIIAMLPIAGAQCLALIKVFQTGQDQYQYLWFVVNDTHSRQIQTSPTGITEKLLAIYFDPVLSWGLGNLSMDLFFGYGYSHTPAAYYALKDIRPSDWAVKPRYAVLPRITSLAGNDEASIPLNEPISLEYGYTSQVLGTVGLPVGWYEKYGILDAYHDSYPSSDSSTWAQVGYRAIPSTRFTRKPYYDFENGNLRDFNFYATCWDWGRPDFCREQLLALGFKPEDLVL